MEGFIFEEYEEYIAPCPFCIDGGQPSVVNSRIPAYYMVRCPVCKSEGPRVDQEYYVNNLHDNIGDENMDAEVLSHICKSAAVDLWNTRYMLH